ncbi:MAG: SGNH/GDSL hydrolase family protein, partial [Eubacteriales bacterium]|nr:SGNH/GDSL hydrolase family protein [Eubacteriales bacterium]
MTKRQAVNIVIFIAIFLALLTMLSYCLRTNGAVKDRFVGFYAEPKNTIDAILIGSSPVFPYYVTPQMYGEEGIVAYPLSTNLQRPVAQLYLTKEALKYQSPQLIVYEVRMYTGRESDMTNNMAYTRGVTD